MKLFTTKESKKFSPEYGWLRVIKFYFLGFHYLTEHHEIEISENLEEKAMMSLKYDRQVSYSEMSANLPELSNENFNKFQSEIYQTRF